MNCSRKLWTAIKTGLTGTTGHRQIAAMERLDLLSYTGSMTKYLQEAEDAHPELAAVNLPVQEHLRCLKLVKALPPFYESFKQKFLGRNDWTWDSLMATMKNLADAPSEFLGNSLTDIYAKIILTIGTIKHRKFPACLAGGRQRMGITGLLPLLRSITKRVHIESLAGQAVAVDAYSWLHKGVYLCAHDLFHQKPTFGYVEYCVSKIKLLRKYNIRPIMVFDGAPLPMKAGKESSRHKNRSDSRKKANEFIEKGDHKSAAIHIHKSIDVTPEMAYILIQELKLIGVDFVVAPYEADAQMAFLDRIGEIAAIITEDSDMLLFGCKKMLYKLDKNGFADEVNLEHIGETTEIELSGFTLERFRQMCILSGCDYLDAIPGFGLKTCHKYFVKYKTAERVLQAIRAEFPSKVPVDFEEKFVMAELTFCHQRVYDHRCQELVHLYPLTEEMVLSEQFQNYGTWEFVGPHVVSGVAKAVARGQLNPITKEPFEVEKENVDTQETLASQKLASKKPVVRSRFFHPVSKEQHIAMTEKRLSIRPAPHVNTSLHASPLRMARGFSTLPNKRLAENTSEAKRPGKTLKIPSFLHSSKRSSSGQSSGTSNQGPVRLDTAQTSLLNFLKRT